MAKPFLVTNPMITVWDNSGLLVASGAKIFTYQAGTTTKLTTYPTQTDAINGTNPNANPVIANSTGRVAAIWATQALKVTAAPSTDTDPPTNAYWTADNITQLAQSVVHQTKTANYTVTISDRDSLIECDASGGSFVISLPTSVSVGDGFNIKIKKIDSSANTVTITPNGVETWDGGTKVLTYQYQYAEAYNDGTKWVGTNYNNTNPQSMSQFLGPEAVFYDASGTWAMHRLTVADYFLLKVAGANTSIVAIDITNALNTVTSGFKLTSFDVIYNIQTANLTTHTLTLNNVNYINGNAANISSVSLSGSLSTSLVVGNLTTISNIVVVSPAYNNTVDSHSIIEVTVVDPGTTVYSFYGINLYFTKLDL